MKREWWKVAVTVDTKEKLKMQRVQIFLTDIRGVEDHGRGGQNSTSGCNVIRRERINKL